MLVSSFLCDCSGCFVLICLLLVLQPGFVWLFSCILLFRLLSVVCDGSGDWLVIVAGCFCDIIVLWAFLFGLGGGWFGLDCSVVALVLQFVGSGSGLFWVWMIYLVGWWFGLFCGVVWPGGGVLGLRVCCLSSACGFGLVVWYGYFWFDDYAALYDGCCLDWFGGLVVGLFVYLRLLLW